MDGTFSQHPRAQIYTCMLWNMRSGHRIVVTILGEHDDRWTGRRCQGALTSFDAPVESFLKSDWKRDVQPEQREPRDARPAPDQDNPYFWKDFWKNFKVAVRP